MKISYDEKEYFLYVKIRDCENSENIHTEDGVVASYDRETDEIVGFAIIHFSEKQGIDLPASDEFEDPAPG